VTIKVSAKIRDPRMVVADVTKATEKQIRRRLEDLGRMMVAEANEEIRRLYRTDTPYDRRRHPGSRRLVNALSYRVVGDEFPLEVEFRTLGGKEVEDRVRFLNDGTKPHVIHASGKWPLKGQKKPLDPTARFRRFTAPGFQSSSSLLAWPEGAVKGGWRNSRLKDGWRYARNQVKHPGNDAGRFLQTGRNRAVNKWVQLPR
jgi:hypothetical protein